MKIKILLLSLFFVLHGTVYSNSEDFESIRKGVVQIKVYSQGFDAFSPWMSTQLRQSTGTGFIIEKNKIVTNAHVVSNAKYIQVQRHNQTTWYEVEIEHIAHDCDLAMLRALDSTFYDDAHVFELGEIPALNSPVNVVGYPIGGDKISVSRGIVSRKEQSTYAHSQVDSHMVIQVDAAINPGNSGGPAIQNNKVVGVAFQVASRGENIGYLIPTSVIRYFLKDLEEKVIKTAVEKSTSWFGRARKEDVLRDSMKTLVSPSVEKQGAEWVPNGKYPPSFRMKVPVYDGKVNMDAVDMANRPIPLTTENLETVFPKRMEARFVVTPSIYVSGQGFGVTWRISYAQVSAQQRVTASQVFEAEEGADDEEQEKPTVAQLLSAFKEPEVEEAVFEAEVPTAAPAVAPPPTPAKQARRRVVGAAM